MDANSKPEPVDTPTAPPAPPTAVVAGPTRVVQLDPARCPAGSRAMVGGVMHVVSDVSTIDVDASLSDEAIAHELGMAFIPKK